MEEEQVDAAPLVSDAQPPLTSDEGEVAAELQEERLDLRDERGLQIVLGVLVLEPQELEHKGILELLLGRDDVLGFARRASCEHRSLVLREHRALIELAPDLAFELAPG